MVCGALGGFGFLACACWCLGVFGGIDKGLCCRRMIVGLLASLSFVV